MLDVVLDAFKVNNKDNRTKYINTVLVSLFFTLNIISPKLSVWIHYCIFLSMFHVNNKTLREKCPYSDFFLVRIFPHSGQKNSEYGHFSRSEKDLFNPFQTDASFLYPLKTPKGFQGQ